MAIGMLQGCFNPEWAQCWGKFASDNAIVAARTVATLCRAIVIFARDALPILSAQQAIGISLAQDQSAELIALREQVSQLTALIATKSVIGPTPQAVPRGNTRVTAWRDLPLKDRKFCWSCGPCGHPGIDCRNPKPGHMAIASWKNQMQSSWKAMFASRGWPTV